ncbi:MAG TPA: nitroreductase family deazaflavin-dependent oxidoreductase [Mycobacteriales bacterium]
MADTYRLGPARRAVNTLMATLLRVGIGPPSSYLLTTTGRTSGRPRTTPVTLVEGADGRWLVAPYGAVGWVHNVRAEPTITLRRGHSTQVRTAEEVDAATAGPVLQRYVRAVKITAPYFDAKADDPVDAFVEEAPRHPVFRVSDPAATDT